LIFRGAIAVCGDWIGDRCLIYFLRGDRFLFLKAQLSIEVKAIIINNLASNSRSTAL